MVGREAAAAVAGMEVGMVEAVGVEGMAVAVAAAG